MIRIGGLRVTRDQIENWRTCAATMLPFVVENGEVELAEFRLDRQWGDIFHFTRVDATNTSARD